MRKEHSTPDTSAIKKKNEENGDTWKRGSLISLVSLKRKANKSENRKIEVDKYLLVFSENKVDNIRMIMPPVKIYCEENPFSPCNSKSRFKEYAKLAC